MFILNKEMDDNVRGDIKISIKRNEINHEMKSCEDRDDDQDCEGLAVGAEAVDQSVSVL